METAIIDFLKNPPITVDDAMQSHIGMHLYNQYHAMMDITDYTQLFCNADQMIIDNNARFVKYESAQALYKKMNK